MKHNNVVSVPAESDDLPKIRSIVLECIHAMEAEGISQWDDVYPAEEDFEKDILNGTLYSIRIDGGLIGCVCINEIECSEYRAAEWECSSFMVVHRLCVHPDYQRTGIGEAAMRFAEEYVLRHGKTSIRLDSYVYNPAALRLYEKLGYSSRGIAVFRKGPFYLFEKKITG